MITENMRLWVVAMEVSDGRDFDEIAMKFLKEVVGQQSAKNLVDPIKTAQANFNELCGVKMLQRKFHLFCVQQRARELISRQRRRKGGAGQAGFER